MKLIIVYGLFQANKRLALKLLFDTGASFTMIPPKAALAIGLDPALSKKRIEVVTASGVEYLPLITVPKVECLGVTVTNLEIVCHELPPSSSVEGLLGLNFMQYWPPFRELLNKFEI